MPNNHTARAGSGPRNIPCARKRQENKLLNAAIEYADQGIRVFPVQARGKVPLIQAWPEKATTDLKTICGWWGRWPQANIGTPTGNGRIVLDVDGAEGEASLRELEAKRGPLPPTALVLTGNGAHFHFALVAEVGNSAGRLGAGLDIRGSGGYVVLPPSIHPSGERYEWLVEGEPAPAPEWLVELLVKPSHSEPARSVGELLGEMGIGQPTDAYRNAALNGEVQKVLEAPEGTRNSTLNTAAYKMAQLCPEGDCEAEREALEAAGIETGLEAREVQATVGSGLRAGAANPRAVASKPEAGADQTALGLMAIADVEREEVRWLWPGRIPASKLTVLDGDPGLGKSTITLTLAALVTRGGTLPDGHALGEPRSVLLLSAEDGAGDTIRPRLEAAGADLARVRMVTEAFSLPDDLPKLEQAITQLGDVALVVIDPLAAYVDGRVNLNKDQDARRALHPVKDVAERTGAAIVVVRHLNKSESANALYRGGGSIGIVGAARSGLMVAPDPDDEKRRILAVVKSNLAEKVDSLAYFVVNDDALNTARIQWEGATNHTADELLSVTPEDRSESGRAKRFLREALAEGRVPATEVQRDAESEGIAKRTLERAKRELGVESNREGRTWYWRLPRGATEGAKTAVPTNLGDVGELGGLTEIVTGQVQALGGVRR